jgi:hexosaminidase
LLGAGFSWNQASANDTGESDIVALLNAHVFRDKEGIMGRLAYDLGNAYLCTGAEPHNSSPLFTILAKSEQLWGGAPSEDLKAVTADRLRETLAYIDKVTSRLSDARMDRTDAALVLEEFRWAADTLRFACRFGIEQFAAGGQVALIPETTRSRLAAELSGITDRHRKIWLSRNRPGGLDDSARRLERTLASLSAKSEEHKS